MSDVNIATVSQKKRIIDIIDDGWLKDCLSDDEIEVPKEILIHDDEDDDNDTGVVVEEKWKDTGLERFMAEHNSLLTLSPATQNQASPMPHPAPASQRQGT